MKKIYLLLFSMISFLATQAQIAVNVTNPANTTPALASSYASLSAALTDVNLVTAMTGPVTLTLSAGSEIAPPTGLTLGSATLNPVLSSTNTITIINIGSTAILNAGVGTSTPGSAVPDGILKLVGVDYVTIDGLTFTDGNTTNPASMEYGLGIFKRSLSDGANNNLIQNCTFNMPRVNNASGSGAMPDGSTGILATNSIPTAATTALVPTAAAGSNSSNRFYANTINGANNGIVIIGYAATTPFTAGDAANDIGGSSAGTGNKILNYGGGAATNPAAGIRVNNEFGGINISYNTINNNNGSGVSHATTLRGIYAQAGTSASANILSNTITINCAATSSSCYGIDNAIGATSASNTVAISGNIIQNCTYATATSGTMYGISSAATATNIITNQNQIINNSIGTSGTGSTCTFYGIYNQSNSPNFTANGNTISNNSLNNTSGAFYAIRGSTSTILVNGNTISNNNIPNTAGTTSSTVYGYYDVASPVLETVTNNNINNLTIGGSSTATSHAVYGIYNVTAAGTKIFSGNNINNLSFTSSSTAGFGSVVGIRNLYAAPSNIFKNIIYSLSSTGITPTVAGLYLGSSSVTIINAYNNIIGNLSTPQSTGLNLFGIYCGSAGTNINLYYNTVYLNATSTGTGFASSAVYMSSTTPTVTMIDNIFVNLSTPTGTGLTTALRRTSTSLTAYGSTSNNNLFYAGTPSASNLIYNDGTNSDQTLSAFQARVTTRESNSISVMPTFLSTTGSDPTFLHINTTFATTIDNGGIAVSGITDDYDGDPRNATTPDIGADEFTVTVVNCNAQPSAGAITPVSASRCANQTYNMIATGLTISSGISYQWKVATVSGGPYSAVSGGTGATTNSYTTGPLTAGTYYYILETTCTPTSQTNKTNELTLVVNGLPTIGVTPTSASFCNPGGTPVTLNASGTSVSYSWSPSTGLSAATGASVTASPTSTTTYIVTGTDGNNCSATASSVITVLIAPSITSVTATPATVCSGSNSQLQANVAGGASGYSFAGSAGTYTPITGTDLGTPAQGDDVAVGNIPIGFTFTYNGNPQTVFAAASNGFIELGSTLTYTNNATSLWTPSANALAGRANIIAPFWEDNNTTGGSIIYKTTGTSPNQVLTVQWTGMHTGGSGSGTNPTLDMQLQLFEGTNQIRFIYGSTSGALLSTTASIGLSGTLGNFLSVTPASPASASSTSSVTENTTIADATNLPSGTTYAFAPPLFTYSWTPTTFLNDPTIANPVATGVTANTTYTVNVGNGTCTVSGTPVTVTLASYTGAPTTQPSTAPVTAGSINDQVLLLDLPQACTVQNMTQLNFTNTSTIPADAANAKVYYTTTATFATANLFGTVANPGGSFSVTGTQALSTATHNYFWLVYDAACNAPSADVIDAGLNSFVIGGNTFTPATVNPAGTRAITSLYVPTRTDGNGTGSIILGSVNSQFAYAVIAGSSLCPGTVTAVNFTATNPNPADVVVAKCYYTTTSTFSNATPFGTAIPNPASGPQTFTGSQVLANGNNYFWVVYDINCFGTVGASVNADINSLVVSSTTIPVTGTATGSNTLVASAGFTTVADGEWSNTTTWACGNVPPTNATAVIIANNITVSNGGNVAGSVTINSGSSLTINPGGTLTTGITGGDKTAFADNGILTVAGGALNINGSLAVASGAKLNQSAGNITVDGNAGGVAANSVPSGTNIVNFVVAAASDINLTGGIFTIVDPHVSSTTTFNVNYSPVGSLPASTGHTFRFGDGISTDAGSSSGFIYYSWNGSGVFVFGNLVIEAGSGGTTRYVNLNGTFYNLEITGNLTINNGAELKQTGTASTGAIVIGGNLTVNAGGILTSPGILYFGSAVSASSTTLSFSSTSLAQTVGGAGTFRNLSASPTAELSVLSVNNTNAAGLTISAPIRVSGTLNMNAGIIKTDPVNMLTLGYNATNEGSLNYTAGKIIGPFKRWIAASAGSRVFPVGTAAALKNANINFTTAPATGGSLTTTWSPVVTAAPLPSLTEPAGPYTVNAVAGQGSWFINAADGLTGGNYTGTFTANGSTDVNSFAQTVLIKRPSAGGAWILDGTHVATTGSNSAPVLSRTGMSGFSEFAIGGQNITVVPVTIEFFTGSKIAGSDYLNWKVSVTSAPSLTIILERSADGKNFSTLQSQNATAARCLQDFSYTDVLPLSGINYYRLKLITPDGLVKYSSIVALLNKSKGFELISVAPNPVRNSTVLSITSVKGGKLDIEVSDITGKVVAQQTVTVIAGNTPVNMDFSKLNAGTYQISAVNADGERKTTRFVKF